MFADEINSDKFTILPSISRGSNSWSSKIIYETDPLVIQTPALSLAFNLNEYSYPNNNKIKYSLTISLNDTVNGVESLKEVINGIDKNVQEVYKNLSKEITYHKSIYSPKESKYPDSFRAKLVANKTRFKCTIMINNKIVPDGIENVKKLLIKGTKASFQIQLNPIWKSNNKYGVSYQILAINIHQHVVKFRKRYTKIIRKEKPIPLQIKEKEKEYNYSNKINIKAKYSNLKPYWPN